MAGPTRTETAAASVPGRRTDTDSLGISADRQWDPQKKRARCLIAIGTEGVPPRRRSAHTMIDTLEPNRDRIAAKLALKGTAPQRGFVTPKPLDRWAGPAAMTELDAPRDGGE